MALDPLAPIRLSFRIGIGVLRFELQVIERLLGLDHPEPVYAPEPEAEAAVVPEAEAVVVPEPEPDVAPPRPAPREREPRAAEAEFAPPVGAAEPEPPEPEPEPEHIDTEPELVGEFAEAGAEEGAGAELHVDEPWDGYQKMQAADVRDRIAVAGAEELAVVELYETTHRRRPTVLEAVERRSKELANSPAGR